VAPQDAAPRTLGTSAVWTVPNLISMARLAGVPLFLWLVIGPQADVWALVVLMVAGFSDWLDGYLARRLDQTSRLGEILDPVADRLYILAAVAGLLYRDIIPWWMAVALPLRDAFLWCLVPFLRTRGYSALPVHYLGKAATAALLYAFPLLFLGDGDGTAATVARVVGWAFAVWGTGLYWWAGLLYAWQVRVLMRTQARRAPKGHPHLDRPDPGRPQPDSPQTDRPHGVDRPDRADA
jgi:cardiolipin synthase